MKRICVISGSRADYGLLYWTLTKLKDSSFFELQICVTGMHLSHEFGMTYKMIEKDGFKIDYKVETLISGDSGASVSKSVGLGIIGFTDVFEKLRPDLILVLGDRFEIFSAVSAGMALRIPIAHCHGGELSLGAIDDAMRHSITKMSHIHFVSTEDYSKRIVQLGEEKSRVFNVGALGIESLKKIKFKSKKQLKNELGINFLEKSFLITFHPETLNKKTSESKFAEILKAVDKFENTTLIFTKPNADSEGRLLIDMIDNYILKNRFKSFCFKSLGQTNYLSTMSNVNLIIGNSSSGLIEAPYFKIPTINVGDRQKGRLYGESVINCKCNYKSIYESIKKGLNANFLESIKNSKNPYGNSNSSSKIINVLKNKNFKNLINKPFVDIKINKKL